jgi:hypothetical protein
VTSEKRVEQRAELVAFPAVEGNDFEPDALSGLLGITPTRTYRRGEVGRSGRVRPHSLWIWETPERVEHDSEVLIREVLETFEPLAGQLSEARSGWDLELQIGLVISMYGSIEVDPDGTSGAVVSTPALYLSPETLRRLTALGCALDVDTYVIAPE